MILNGLLTAVRNKFLPMESGNHSINSTSPPSTSSSLCNCEYGLESTDDLQATMGGIKRIVSNFSTTYNLDEEEELEEPPRRRCSTSARLTRPDRIKRMLDKLEKDTDDLPNDIDDRCHICLVSRASVRAYPCGHQIFCRKCGVRFIQVLMETRSEMMNCLLCRRKIDVLRYQKPSQPLKVPSERIFSTHEMSRSWPWARSNS